MGGKVRDSRNTYGLGSAYLWRFAGSLRDRRVTEMRSHGIP